MSAYRALWEIFPAMRLILHIQDIVARIILKLSLSTVWNGTDSFARYLATAVVHWAHLSLPCLYLVEFAKAADIVGCQDAFVLNAAAAPDLATVVGGIFASSEGWWTRMCPNKFVVCLSFTGTHFLHIVQIGFVGSLGSPFTSGKKTKICPNSRFNVLFWHWIAVGHFVFCFLADVTAPSLSS